MAVLRVKTIRMSTTLRYMIVICASVAGYSFLFLNAENSKHELYMYHKTESIGKNSVIGASIRLRESANHRNKSDRDRVLPNDDWTPVHVTRRRHVLSGDGQIYIIGATGKNSTTIGGWDKINVYGQRYAGEQRLHSCLKYPDGEIVQRPTETKYEFATTGSVALPLPMFIVECGNVRQQVYGEDEGTHRPVAVSIVLAESSCDSQSVGFIEPFEPLRQTENTLAITTNISHGNLSRDLLITWMEAYLWLGVDKVIAYATSDLNTDARKVLEYYARKSVLELYDYHIPGLKPFPRSMHVPSAQTWADAAVTMTDAYMRNSGYTYFSVVDWHEFLIPSRNRTLKQLMGDLFHESQSAAGFKFKSRSFITTAEPEASDMFLKKHVHRLRSQPMFDRPKIIFKPDRAHVIEPSEGYMLLECDSSEAYVRSFRDCKSSNSHDETCNTAKELDLVRDTSTAEWTDNIAQNIRRVKAELFP